MKILKYINMRSLFAILLVFAGIGTIAYASICPDQAGSGSVPCIEPTGDQQFCEDMSDSTCNSNKEGFGQINSFPDSIVFAEDFQTYTDYDYCYTIVDCAINSVGDCKAVKGSQDWHQRNKIFTIACFES
jgi:hypothetical protein